MAQANDDDATASTLYQSALKQRLFPLPWALTAIDYGTLLIAQDHTDTAESMLREAVTALEKIGATAYLPVAQRHLDNVIERNSSAQSNAYAAMTAREREVAELLAEGHSNKAIAERLVVSESTARFHVSNILRKLQLHSRAEVPRVLKEMVRNT
jgi:DNA-binding NarL/FixJ family response regulator